MNPLKTATDWARTEMLSNSAFILIGIAFLANCFSLWHMCRTEMARSFVWPMGVAGVLLLILGGGSLFGTWSSLSGFAEAATHVQSFVTSEHARIDQTRAGYATAVFKVMPLMVAAAALGIVFFDGPLWRASFITAVAFLSVVMVVDSMADARLGHYRAQLAQG